MRIRIAILVAAILIAPALAGAVDGVVEINQATILAQGGFPFFGNDGSYRLTGNLTVPDGDTTAIILGRGTLDLNGFTIAGPAVCTRSNYYDARTTTCTNSGFGTGVFASGGRITNGRITGFGSVGISGGSSAVPLQVENVQIDNNAQGGVSLDNGVLRNSAVTNNGGAGVFDCACGDAGVTTIVEGNSIAFNKLDGIALGALILGNRITYNGGAGIKHANAGGARSRINDNFIHRNLGVAIDAFGSYSNNAITQNASLPTQVIGGMFDAGGNSTN